MKSLVLYVSFHHFNTEKVAKEIAAVLEAPMINLFTMEGKDLEDFDHLCLGSGIYFWRTHSQFLQLVEEFPSMRRKKASIFSTAGIPSLRWHRLLRKSLIAKGFAILGEFTCPGWDTYYRILRPFGGLNRGRPNRLDLEKAQIFAQTLLSLASEDDLKK